MKTKKLIERLSLFLLALVLTMPALAQKERGGGEHLQHRLGSRLENVLRPRQWR